MAIGDTITAIQKNRLERQAIMSIRDHARAMLLIGKCDKTQVSEFIARSLCYVDAHLWQGQDPPFSVIRMELESETWEVKHG